MTENLLTPSVIKMFGRLMTDISFKYDQNTVYRGYNNLLQRQLVARNRIQPVNVTGETTLNPDGQTISNIITSVSSVSGLIVGMTVESTYNGTALFTDPTEILSIDSKSSSFSVDNAPLQAIYDPKKPAKPAKIVASYTEPPNFARIYAFSYEGAYYALPRPAIFLIHGKGLSIVSDSNSWSQFESSGVMGREWDFSSADPGKTSDLRYWEYEKGDFSIRLDPEAGPFEQILLMATLRAGVDRADRSGMQLSGMQLSGMQLSGMQLSGMQLGVNPNNRNGR